MPSKLWSYLVVSSICSFFVMKASDLIPLSLLTAHPTLEAPLLSPDGKKVAFLAPYQSAMNIWVKGIDSSNRAAVTTATHTIEKYWWSYDNQTILYFQDQSGNENWNLCAVNSVTHEHKNLTPFADVQVRLIAYSRKHPQVVLISMNKEAKHLHDVYLVTIATGELTLVEKNPGYIGGFDMEASWYADEDLNIRIALSIDDQGNTLVLHRKKQEDPWKNLITWDVNASAASTFVGFCRKEHGAYFVDASESETSRLVKINLDTQEKVILAHDTTYDITNVLDELYTENPTLFKHPITHEPLAVFLECDTVRTIVLHDSIATDVEYLQQFCDGKLHIRSSDDALQKWVVVYTYSDRPAQYYIYDRVHKTMQPVISDREPLLNYQCARSNPITFSARDGLTIHGYLTYPTTTTTYTSLPLVVVVHGGPWMRDTWKFNKRVQLLANRGYACLQLNYRGSAGYGTSFVKAGNKEFGRAMQHDLTDAVQALINQGIADPKRIAIMGGSYGGYATLAGAVFTPTLYACAVDLYGRANLVITAESIPAYWEKSAIVWKHRIGDPVLEEAMMRERSPLFHVDNIQIPMLIVHGAHDARIHQTESDLIVAALHARNIPCEYLLFSDEGHGIDNVQSRTRLYYALEHFLATHLGGRCEPAVN